VLIEIVCVCIHRNEYLYVYEYLSLYCVSKKRLHEIKTSQNRGAELNGFIPRATEKLSRLINISPVRVTFLHEQNMWICLSFAKKFWLTYTIVYFFVLFSLLLLVFLFTFDK
jgi:hypothetical protein